MSIKDLKNRTDLKPLNSSLCIFIYVIFFLSNPMVTGTSVLGVKFTGGVMIAADMLGSYGSLARFRNISRLMKVNNSTILGASGDYADYQYLKQVIEQMV